MVASSGSGLFHELGQAKIQNFNAPAGVTIMLPGLMSRCTMPAVCAAASAPAIWAAYERVCGSWQPVLGDELVKGRAVDTLHDDEVGAVVRVDLMDSDNVGMIQCGRGLGLLHEAALTVGICHLIRRQELDGYQAIEAGVAGPIDHAHAASYRFFEKFVMA